MPHPADDHDLLRVIDAIQDPVVTHAQTETSASATDALSPVRAGIVGQLPNAGIQAYQDRGW
jgi:hypothetical protein